MSSFFVPDPEIGIAYADASGCACAAFAVFSLIRDVPTEAWNLVETNIRELFDRVQRCQRRFLPGENLYADFCRFGSPAKVGKVAEVSAHSTALALGKWVLNEIWTAAFHDIFHDPAEVDAPGYVYLDGAPADADQCFWDRPHQGPCAQFFHRPWHCSAADPIPQDELDLRGVSENYAAVVNHFLALASWDAQNLLILLKAEATITAKGRNARPRKDMGETPQHDELPRKRKRSKYELQRNKWLRQQEGTDPEVEIELRRYINDPHSPEDVTHWKPIGAGSINRIRKKK